MVVRITKINETINSPNQSSRNGKTPQLIVYHICDGTYEGAKSWFLQSASQVSSHFIVAQDGRICQCAPLERMAWCNGTTVAPSDPRYFGNSTVPLVKKLGGNANEYSVSIECEGFWGNTQGLLTGKQLDALAWLTKHIQAETGRLFGHKIPFAREYLVGHHQINPKTRPNCPGERFQWGELVKRSNAAGPAAPETPGMKTPQDKTLYRVQVGAFGVRTNAENMLRSLKDKGFDGFIVEQKEIQT